MADLAVITPTRGRPLRFIELLEAVDHTAELDTQVVAGVDDDDPALYAPQLAGRVFKCDPVMHGGPRKSLSAWTNHLAAELLKAPNPPRYLASLGDDHRPRTGGWDARLVEAIKDMGGTGIAYGNDLFQGRNLPTAWVVSADIVQKLGWMMLPTLAHMYVDNATLELGRAAGCITYQADVIIEHQHPLTGKANWDKSYRDTNTPARYEADQVAFETWKRDGLPGDAEKIRALASRQRALSGG